LSDQNAASLLKCWTALWHPSLLAFSKVRPDIWSIGVAEEDGSLEEDVSARTDSGLAASVPRFVVADFDQAIVGLSNARAVCRDSPELTRADIVASLTDSLGIGFNQAPEDSLAPDFFSLGYAWLQVRLMTLHVRYSTNLDNDVFDAELIEAAVAWEQGNQELATEKLTRCFDLLHEEKNNYYSVEPELIDLVLVEKSTIGSRLESQLSCEHKINVLCSGDTVAAVEREKPSACQTMKARLANGSLTMVGGLQRELPSALIPLESQLRQFLVGRRTFNATLDVHPDTFARRQFGLTSMTPGLLEQLDYQGACHVTLDGGVLPEVHGLNMRWDGEDAQTIPGLATIPLDANDARSFLCLGPRIAKQIDSEHTSTVVFAHWPDRYCETFLDLIRLTKYGSLFGDFVGLDDHFEATYDPGYGDSFTAEQYECPWLTRAVQRQVLNPISRFVKYWGFHYGLFECRSLMTMLAFAHQHDDANFVQTLSSWKSRIELVEGSLDALVDFSEAAADAGPLVVENEEAIDSLRADIVNHFVRQAEDSSEASQAVCVLNPFSCSRDVFLSGSSFTDVPAMGWVTVSEQQKSNSVKAVGGPPVDDGLTLRNEFLQVMVHPESGGIRSLQGYDNRQTQASQRLSVRMPAGKRGVIYADMVADDVSVDRVSPIESRITSTGQLIDPQTSQRLCGFTQTVSLRRKDRFAKIQIELQGLNDLTADAEHYVCSRLAWHEESSPLYYGCSEVRSRSTNAWIDAPAYVRIEQSDHSVTLLTNGLPWHRRAARNLLDSVLVVANENERRFELSIGLDCPYDLSAATEAALSPRQLDLPSGAFGNSGWLFHFSCKHIVSLFSEPLISGDRVVGVRWRLLETQGRRGKLKLSCPFNVVGADRTMFDGRPAGSLAFDGRVVEIEFTRNEYFELSVYSDHVDDV